MLRTCPLSYQNLIGFFFFLKDHQAVRRPLLPCKTGRRRLTCWMSLVGRSKLFLLSRLARSQHRCLVCTCRHPARSLKSEHRAFRSPMIDRSQSGRGEAVLRALTSTLLFVFLATAQNCPFLP